jgi:lysophospholipase L1-like esterase
VRPASHGEPPPGHAPRLTWRKKLLFSCVVLLLGLGFAEVVVRLVVGQPLPERLPLVLIRAHRTRGWEMVPNSVHYTYQHRVAVNSLGLRGPELPPDKAPDERRILVLGDSMVYGQGVADADTVPAQLERALDRPGVTVVNGGLRAYSTAQELALLKDLDGRIRPDLVFLCWFWNDIDPEPIEQEYGYLVGKGDVPQDTRTPLEGVTLLKWRMRQVVRKSALVMLTYDLFFAEHEEWPSKEVQAVGIGMLDADLAEFRRWSDARGVPVVFVVIPNPNCLREGHPSEALEQEVAALARRHGMAVVETLPALRELAGREGSILLPFEGHYGPAGNGVIAGELAREARRHLQP